MWGGGRRCLRDHTLVKAPVLKFPPTSSPASPCVEKDRPASQVSTFESEMCLRPLCMERWRTVRVPWWAQTTQGEVTTGSQGTHRQLISNVVVACHSSPNKVLLQSSWDPSHKLVMLYSRGCWSSSGPLLPTKQLQFITESQI